MSADILARTLVIDDDEQVPKLIQSALEGFGYRVDHEPSSQKAASSSSVSTRIVSIADLYDALITDRSYRKAFTTRAAFDLMDEEVQKGWWDPELLEEFKYIFNETLLT